VSKAMVLGMGWTDECSAMQEEDIPYPIPWPRTPNTTEVAQCEATNPHEE
jgi:hypothetical protein